MAQTKKQNKVAVGGNVKISAYKGKRKIKQISTKNNATYHLFNFLLECLRGNLKQNNRPAYLRIKAVESLDNFDAEVQDAPEALVKLNNSVINSYTASTRGKITNQFYMLYGAFNTNGNTPVYPKIFILQDSNRNELAKVSLTRQTTIKIDPTLTNYSLLIDWSISFQNPAVEAVQQ